MLRSGTYRIVWVSKEVERHAQVEGFDEQTSDETIEGNVDGHRLLGDVIIDTECTVLAHCHRVVNQTASCRFVCQNSHCLHKNLLQNNFLQTRHIQLQEPQVRNVHCFIVVFLTSVPAQSKNMVMMS